jgi:dephospho-CoA kinase
MIIIGLTGSMGTGKSELVRRIRSNLSWPIWDADAEVNLLYKDPAVIEQIVAAFPKAVEVGGTLSRRKLGEMVSQNPDGLDFLENILHPLLAVTRNNFLNAMNRLSQPIVILDIPLLFEKGLDQLCDLTVVTSCPHWLQKQRILSRSSVTEEMMEAFLSRQIPSSEKKKLADIVVETGLNRGCSWRLFIQSLRELAVI